MTDISTDEDELEDLEGVDELEVVNEFEEEYNMSFDKENITNSTHNNSNNIFLNTNKSNLLVSNSIKVDKR